MPDRDGYIAGVPCWVDTSQPDRGAAAEFYGGLFGWEFGDAMPARSPGRYLVARLRGGDVAAVSSQPGRAPVQAVWNTCIWVEDGDPHVAVEVAEEDAGVSVWADADQDDRPLDAHGLLARDQRQVGELPRRPTRRSRRSRTGRPSRRATSHG